MTSPASPGTPVPLDELVATLGRDELIEVVTAAAERHADVERALRLVGARAGGDLAPMRDAVDRGLRTRRFLDYHESREWAQAGRPIAAELRRLADTAPSRELVELVQRAVGHVVKVMHHADDSDGAIGTLALELLDVHATACDAGVADPKRLASWMLRFRFKDQDFFDPDPVRYGAALGDQGLAAYRKGLDAADVGDTYGILHARERLAVLDRDVDAIVRHAGGTLTASGQFLRVAQAMREIERPDLVLEWTQRGIEATSGYPIGALYDLACETQLQLGRPLEALRLRRAHHERSPGSGTYAALKAAALDLDVWESEREAARARLRDRDVRGFVVALLADEDDELAWQTAASAPDGVVGAELRIELAKRREPTHPLDALGIYCAVADEFLVTTGRDAYARAVRVLKKGRAAAGAANRADAFTAHIAALREHHRRRPALIAMLDKAGLTGA